MCPGFGGCGTVEKASPKCRENEFCELRLGGVLGSSRLQVSLCGVAPQFVVHHVPDVGVQVLRLSRGISDGGEPYPAGNSERTQHVEGDTGLWITLADAREATLSVPGVRWANVTLDDHYASDEINGGVNEGQGFDGAFPAETEGPNLGELRSTFQRKSFVGRQENLCRALLADGRMPAELVPMRVGVGGCGVRLRRARRVSPHLPPILPPATPMENDLGSSMNCQTDPS